MNKVILIGRLTKDPELSTTASGISVCRLSLAVSRRFKNADGERETDFFNIVAWRDLGETCHRFLKKGNQVAIVGSIQNRSYDAADGSKRYVTDIVAEEIDFISPKNSSDSEENSAYAPSQEPKAQPKQTAELEEIDDDSLPF